MKNTILVQLNEMNFDWVEEYIKLGELKNFERLISEYGLHTTSSELKYDELEPWIQWVSVYTGKPFKEHGVFRLGDFRNYKNETLYEELSKKFSNVNAICPMNYDNKYGVLKKFIPDPWTKASPVGGWIEKGLYKAASQAVNDNSKGHIHISSILFLFFGIIRLFNLYDYKKLFKMVSNIFKGKSWYKAIILDYLLAKLCVKYSSGNFGSYFTSVFLNAGAHIQHHYMFNSSVYKGEFNNPQWYVKDKEDPVLDIYKEYDEILGEMYDIPNSRLIIATGLSQTPYVKKKFYWRLSDHTSFLNRLGLDFLQVEPRMTRDFLVSFSNNSDRDIAKEKLSSIVDSKSRSYFGEFEVRDRELFITLTYPFEVVESSSVYLNGELLIENVKDYMVFVALKNGMHMEKGFLLDSDVMSKKPEKIWDMKNYLLNSIS